MPRLTRKTAVGAIVAASVLGGGVAFAYPPGTGMAAAATAEAQAGGGAMVTVMVDHTNPKCDIVLSAKGADDVTVPAGHPVQITQVIAAGNSRGSNRVRVRTSNCKPKESTEVTYYTVDAKVESARTAYRGRKFKVAGDGFNPYATVTFVLTPKMSSAGSPLSVQDTANKRGEAKATFQLPAGMTPGDWLLTGMDDAGGKAGGHYVNVRTG